VLQAYLDLALANPEVYHGAFMWVRPGSMPKPKVRSLDELDMHRLLRDALREGQATGRLADGDADLQAQLLWAGLHGALALPNNLEMFAFARPETLTSAMVDHLMAGLARPRVNAERVQKT
jgi:AcrR family transcriptional regulator